MRNLKSRKAREEAIARGENFYVGLPCKHGHIGRRYVKGGACSECHMNPERREYRRKHNMRCRYGLDSMEYEALWSTQEGQCGICLAPLERTKLGAHIDHCHSTNMVRGILCHRCNRGLGLFADNIVVLRSAITYLEKHKCKAS